jgi:hypothetical protein
MSEAALTLSTAPTGSVNDAAVGSLSTVSFQEWDRGFFFPRGELLTTDRPVGLLRLFPEARQRRRRRGSSEHSP